MKNKFIKLLVALFTILGLTITTTPAFALDDICTLKDDHGNYVASEEIRAASGCEGTTPTAGLEDSIMKILNGVLILLGTVAVVVVVIGGIQYMTSAGDPGKTKKAKDTILYACIGLVVVILAAFTVNFVIGIIYPSTY